MRRHYAIFSDYAKIHGKFPRKRGPSIIFRGIPFQSLLDSSNYFYLVIYVLFPPFWRNVGRKVFRKFHFSPDMDLQETSARKPFTSTLQKRHLLKLIATALYLLSFVSATTPNERFKVRSLLVISYRKEAISFDRRLYKVVLLQTDYTPSYSVNFPLK